jgi:hypothetical protein
MTRTAASFQQKRLGIFLRIPPLSGWTAAESMDFSSVSDAKTGLFQCFLADETAGSEKIGKAVYLGGTGKLRSLRSPVCICA